MPPTTLMERSDPALSFLYLFPSPDMASKPQPTALEVSDTSAVAAATEASHVHEVYERIAEHFSATRYKVGLGWCHGRNPSTSHTHAPRTPLALACG
jgi:hypothetical protein